MIVDKLSNAEQYYKLGPRIEKAFKYIKNIDLSQIEIGKYQIDDDKIFAVVSEYETKNLEKGLWEAHRNYIDIQYIITGKEKMGYSCIDDMKPLIEYEENKDVLFVKGQGDYITINEGAFALFTPNDAHMPSIKVNNTQFVKKLLVKILVD
ncbi:MAG TPA: YhcH/YjgK/YiaL family protein [Clostridium sp.]|uniref:YhcH/YjgK/YiaL family protein n=1 Tax=Clostridium sp. TaxID=1506 RepID=UPI002F94B505